MDPASEKRLGEVHPALAAKVRAAAAKLMAQGVEIRVVQGLRSAADQDRLYAQGRDVLVDPLGNRLAIVTNARGGYSSHNFGLAVDVVPGLLGVHPWKANWNEPKETPEDKAAFQAMVAELKAQGLKWGGDWVHMKGDYDHFYLADSPANPTNAMRADLKEGGLLRVFHACDAGEYAEAVAV